MSTHARNRLSPKHSTVKSLTKASRSTNGHSTKGHTTKRKTTPKKSKTESTEELLDTAGKSTGPKRTGIRRAKSAPIEGDHMVQKALDETYNRWKEFEGQRYTGMKVGSHHKWYYDQGVWREQKMTPDEWTFEYAVKKRRAGKAPKGSGVPTGTEYHWYVLGHQMVRKLNANIYSTALSGIKFKVAHKRSSKGKWSVSEPTQKKRIIRFMKEMIKQLEEQGDE